MRLRIVLKKRKIFGYLILILALLLPGYYLIYIAGCVEVQYITGDHIFSQGLDRAIRNLLEQNIKQSSDMRFLALKNNFPMVKKLKIDVTGLNKVHTQFVAADLLYRLGSNFVLTRDGAVFLVSHFSERALKTLPSIYLHTSPEIATDIEQDQIDFLLKLPEFIVPDYEVHWYGKNKIVLVKSQPNHQIIVKHDQKITPEILVTCENLITKYQEHASKKCRGAIQTDLRFDQQIIVAC